MTSHVPSKHPVAFGAQALGKSESVYYNVTVHIFSQNIHRSADVAYNIAWVLRTICIASKSLWKLNLFIAHETQICLEMNVKTST